MRPLHFLLTLSCCAFIAVTARAQTPAPFYVPQNSSYQVLLSHENLPDKRYLAFPASVQLDRERILIIFKRGSSHGGDQEADADALIFNTKTNQVLEHIKLGHLSGKIFQLTVPVMLSDGSIQLYTDLQNRGHDGRNYRDGILFSTLKPPYKTTSEWKKLPVIDGIEYGYAFDFIVEGKTVYMLAMSFGYRPGGKWSVAVLRSDDGANSWKFVKDITQALGGGPINESAFVRKGKDFFVVCRGYQTQATRIARFDQDFKLLGAADLTGENRPLGYNIIGWPRIFLKDDQLYVLGRVYPHFPKKITTPTGKDMRLGLVRINAESLEIEKVSLLDNAYGDLPVSDAYYAAYYWNESGGVNWFNTITYRKIGDAAAPDLVRIAFPWDEVK